MNSMNIKELAIIDGRVADSAALAADLADRARVVVLDGAEDGLARLGALLSGTGPLRALHIVGHGEPGQVILGSATLSAGTLRERSALTSGWGEALAGADILVYGCRSGAGAEGRRFVETLAEITGASVAASDRPVGAAGLGGDWTLGIGAGGPVRTGIAFSEALQASYAGVFATVTFDITPDHVVENPASSVTFSFELDEAPAAGSYVSVWLYATTTANAPVSEAIHGYNAELNQFDLFSVFLPGAQVGIDLFSYDYDATVVAGVSTVPDFGVIELRLTQKSNSITLRGYNDAVDDGPRTVYWNLADDPTKGPATTIVNPSILFTEVDNPSEVPPSNTAPVADDDSATTAFGTAVEINVLANDSDANGDTLTIAAVTQGANGSVAISGGQVVYTPNAGFSGADSFTYTVSDGKGGSDTATVGVQVGEKPNTAPGAAADTALTQPGKAVSIDVLANDNDADGDALTIAAITQGANGSVAISGGQVVYTPNAGFAGADSFTYTVDDGQGGSATATVEVTVAQPVVGMSANKTTLVESQYDTVTFTFDVENIPEEGVIVSVALYRPGDSGADTLKYGIADFALFPVVVPGVGVLMPQLDGVQLVGGWRNNEGITFRILKDGATVTLPIAPDDPDRAPGETGFTRNSDIGVEQQVWRLVDFHNLNPGLPGTDDYVVAAGAGEVTLTLKDTPDRTYEATDDRVATAGRPVEIDVMANDNGAVRIVSVENPATSTQGLLQNGTIAIDDKGTADTSDDTIVYTPNAGFVGRDVFAYLVENADGQLDEARVTVDVGSFTNADPAAGDDNAATAFGTAVEIDVLANDSDADGDALTIAAVTQGANGSVAISGGRVVYTPNAGFAGPDSFTYTVSDGFGGSSTATVSVAVAAQPNAAPSAGDDSATTAFGAAVEIDVLANDSDADGDALAIAAVTQGANGSVAISGGQVVYTPNAGFAGADSFTYTVSDGKGGSATATVGVQVEAQANTAPAAADDTAVTRPGTAVTIDVLANDSDADGDALVLASVGQGANGSVSIVDGKAVYTPNAGFEGADSFSYTVSDGRGGETTASVAVNVARPVVGLTADKTTLVESQYDEVTFTFNVENLPPEGVIVSLALYRPGDSGTDTVTFGMADFALFGQIKDGEFQFPEMSGVDFIGVWANNDGITLRITENGATATLPIWLDDPDRAPGETGFTRNTDVGVEELVWRLVDFDTLNPGLPKTEDYAVAVGAGEVTLTLKDTPDQTYMGGDDVAQTNGRPIVLDVLANDPDGVKIVSFQKTPWLLTAAQAAAGTVTLDDRGTADTSDDVLVFTPKAGFVGKAGFAYLVENAAGERDQVQVKLDVTALTNEAPETAEDSATTAYGTAVEIDVLANDSDADGDALVLASVGQGANGSVAVVDGKAVYTPNAGFAGADSFTYTVNDGYGGIATGTASVVVAGPENGAPVAADDAYATRPNQSLVVDATAGLLANDADPDGDALTVVGFDTPANGTLSANADGSFTYTPNAGFVGVETIGYVVSDGVETATAQLTIEVKNQAPAFTASGPFEVAENTALAGVVAATDADGDAVSYSIVGGADAALFDIDAATGMLSFKSAPDYEAPQDAGADNVYDLIIGATDSFAFVTTTDVQVAVTDEAESTPLNPVIGTSGRDILDGTQGADRFVFNGGVGDVARGNGGDDVFDFAANAANGIVDNTRIMDWSAGDAITGFTLADIHAETVRTSSNTLRFAYGPDNDVLTITGDVSGGIESLFWAELA